MLSYYNVLKSDLTLVPSQYSKSMFPKELHHKIKVQFEGFKLDQIQIREDCQIKLPNDKQLIGFAARSLCTSKGFDFFLKVSKAILAIRNDIIAKRRGECNNGFNALNFIPCFMSLT